MVLVLFIPLFQCTNIETERAHCEKQAQNEFLLCLINVATGPDYFGRPDWKTQEIQSYSQGFCIADYNRKLECPSKKTYKPTRKN